MTKFEKILKLKKNNFEIDSNPCWEGYEPYGTKIVDGREVPNCVPTKEEMSKIVKEGFPIPSPSSDEDEQMYVSRCISSIIDEYGQEQASAICYATWRDK
jgi:hypothetical protein